MEELPPSLKVVPLHAVHPLQASKWLDIAALLDVEEMASLIESLGEFYIYFVNGTTEIGREGASKQQFLECYREYIAALKEGRLPEAALYRSYFSSAWTAFPEHLCSVPVGEGKQLTRVIKPVVQLQIHSMHYSPVDHKFRSMTFGSEGILWGIQFSFPQMYKDLEEEEIIQIKADFPNHALFQKIQRWVRSYTIPTPFLIEGQKVNISARLGKASLPWINRHPDLLRKGFAVV
jgi:hypothetical protein